MSEEHLQPGSAFQFQYLHVETDIFLFDHFCEIKSGEGLFRRFNRVGAFIEPNWYRFPIGLQLFTRAKEFDFER
ncbi:MAG: hypothetical protein NPIRA03_25750 [Nitrospirales bacterium]|nr:MAG: hypothetical protein NPIRA03_25750 [Nitrospirales bacterium]